MAWSGIASIQMNVRLRCGGLVCPQAHENLDQVLGGVRITRNVPGHIKRYTQAIVLLRIIESQRRGVCCAMVVLDSLHFLAISLQVIQRNGTKKMPHAHVASKKCIASKGPRAPRDGAG